MNKSIAGIIEWFKKPNKEASKSIGNSQAVPYKPNYRLPQIFIDLDKQEEAEDQAKKETIQKESVIEVEKKPVAPEPDPRSFLMGIELYRYEKYGCRKAPDPESKSIYSGKLKFRIEEHNANKTHLFIYNSVKLLSDEINDKIKKLKDVRSLITNVSQAVSTKRTPWPEARFDVSEEVVCDLIDMCYEEALFAHNLKLNPDQLEKNVLGLYAMGLKHSISSGIENSDIVSLFELRRINTGFVSEFAKTNNNPGDLEAVFKFVSGTFEVAKTISLPLEETEEKDRFVNKRKYISECQFKKVFDSRRYEHGDVLYGLVDDYLSYLTNAANNYKAQSEYF